MLRQAAWLKSLQHPKYGREGTWANSLLAGLSPSFSLCPCVISNFQSLSSENNYISKKACVWRPCVSVFLVKNSETGMDWDTAHPGHSHLQRPTFFSAPGRPFSFTSWWAFGALWGQFVRWRLCAIFKALNLETRGSMNTLKFLHNAVSEWVHQYVCLSGEKAHPFGSYLKDPWLLPQVLSPNPHK